MRSPAIVDRLRAASSDGSRAGCLGRYVQRRRIEGQDLARRGLLVEPLPGLRADPARAATSSLDERRQRELRRSSAIVKPLGQIPRDVGEHVDAGDVHRAERRALRPADRRTGDRVDLFDGVLARLERAQDLHDAEQADVIGDEVRRVLRDDDALAEAMIGEMRSPRRRRPGRCRRSG